MAHCSTAIQHCLRARHRLRARFAVPAAAVALALAAPVAGVTTQALAASGGTVEHWGTFTGDGDGDMNLEPVSLNLPSPPVQIGTSNSTQYALLANGDLYSWGLGGHGELGNGSTTNSFTKAVRVRFPAGVKIASIPTDVMPFDTGLAVDTTGHAWGWGFNAGGELCLGNRKEHLTPFELPFSDVTTLAGAFNHAVYDASGTVYGCGGNPHGELGDGTTAASTTPVKVKRLSGPVVALVAAFANAGALLANGEYFDWGADNLGQVGNGVIERSVDLPFRVPLPGPVTQVAQGGSVPTNGQTLVMLTGGSIDAWGSDAHYQLGNGTTGTDDSPIPVSPPAGVTYQTLACGGSTCYAIATTGDVYAWGEGKRGQVGDGTTKTARRPVRVWSGAAMISATANDVAVSGPAGQRM